MNNQERTIAILLGLTLVGWMFYSNKQAAQRAREAALNAPPPASETTDPDAVLPPTQTALAATSETPLQPEAEAAPPAPPSQPEEIVTLNGGEMTLALSSHGAVIKQVTLSRYLSEPGGASDSNPPVTLDFANAPSLECSGLPGLAPNAAYSVTREESGKAAAFSTKTAQGLALTRRIELLDNYQVKVTDTLRNEGTDLARLGTNSVTIGAMQRGTSKNDMLSIDSLPAFAKAKVHHWDSEKATKQYLVGGTAGGCRGKVSAAGMPERITVPVIEPQAWVAIKSRFFVTGFSSGDANCGFTATMTRDTAQQIYALNEVSARVFFPGSVLGAGETATREYALYIGPKKLSLLQQLGNGMDAVMQFGTFAWFCKLLVPTLNFFHRLIPDYGIAIILLTFLVRIIFWPLTHSSTVSMKKMQELQPKLKELQTKFKDNPQKMQQETWALYRENKVNPLSSCLPMLIQIPVFIALFTVLRSAVELRYAPFLWIADLSEPENLLAGVLPIPLNILPILMSGTMALQSYLTPSTGDPQQQKMMMVMMPVMMLLMFYNFPSALALYWTVSQILAIIQMIVIRRKTARAGQGPGDGVTPEVPLTRQQRRHAP
ncbi:MAG: membrane protein insertase YidC [Kiritimatiellae bacterium]|jgi:YidC/Oxa1 family membrane protein insertase|nr:membrane protein insertase YidC [Kiritimatiellia bacterium]MDD3583022.1 membrane protein insertase YidC [Kiritimatiellia bacterium]